MPPRPDSRLGPLEADVLAFLWRVDRPVDVREVLDALNKSRDKPLAYTTVMTVMSRLAEKGVLLREFVGRSYMYRPAVRDAAQLAVRGVVAQFGDAALTHFVDQARTDPKLMRRLRKLMDADD